MAVVPDELLELAAQRFALLGDPTRLRLVSALHRGGELSVGDLAAATGVSVANTSQHLLKLAGSGLVCRRRAGTTIMCAIADDSVEQLCNIVCASLERSRGRQSAA